MLLRHPRPSSSASAAAWLLPRQFSMRASDAPFRVWQVASRRHTPTIAEHGEIDDAEVDSDWPLRLAGGRRGSGHFRDQRDVPVAGVVATEGSAARWSRRSTRETQSNPADLGNEHAVAAEDDALRDAESLRGLTAREAGESRAFFEEVPKRATQIHQSLLQQLGVNVVHPLIAGLRLQRRQSPRQVSPRDGRSRRTVMLEPALESPVVGESPRPCEARKRGPLGRSRIQPVAVSALNLSHEHMFAFGADGARRAADRIRTDDPLLTMEVLCLLSYGGVCRILDGDWPTWTR